MTDYIRLYQFDNGGSLISKRGTYTNHLRFDLKYENNESKTRKCAVEVESGHTAGSREEEPDKFTNGVEIRITNGGGATTDMWRLAPDNAGVPGEWLAWGTTLPLGDIAGGEENRVYFWVEAKSADIEEESVDRTVILNGCGFVDVIGGPALEERTTTAHVASINVVTDTTWEPALDEFGAGAYPYTQTVGPIGGGEGYQDIYTTGDYVVSTKTELLNALSNASSGDVIYVTESANIDLTNTFDTSIPAGVTLASNRGYNSSVGGRIYQTRDEDPGNMAMFYMGGQNVRITGLRIEGPDKTSSWPGNVWAGIHTIYRNLEVDNCEIFGWSYTGVRIRYTGGSTFEAGGYIHHNHIHKCQTSGMGYGVMVANGGTALIEANYMELCRHAVAGAGSEGDGYICQYNIFGPDTDTTDAFQVDMHGQLSGGTYWAGTLMYINHNTFKVVSPPEANPIRIRGKPRDCCYVYNNWFYYTSYAPVWQINSYGNLSVIESLIGAPPDEEYSATGPIRYL